MSSSIISFLHFINPLQKKIRVITHDGRFHADDVFAVAALSLYFNKQGKRIHIIRSRDPVVIATGDIVVDNGRTYDPEKNIFDHHQTGGAGTRTNGVPYAAFGLIWKHFGDIVCESSAVARIVDEKLVQSIDFVDTDPRYADVQKLGINHYMMDDLVKSLYPTRDEQTAHDETHMHFFMRAVDIAKEILTREIIKARYVVQDSVEAEKVYAQTGDKRIIVFDAHISWSQVLCAKPEPLFVIHPKYHGEYAVRAVPVVAGSYENKAYLPKEWGGKSGEELEKISGIPGATFCHSGLHLCGAKTLNAAITMAQKAVAIHTASIVTKKAL